MAKEKIVLELEADTGNLNKSLEAADDAIKNLSTSGQKAVGALDKVTGGLASSFVQTAKGVQTFIKGLNLTKVAILGTGIGALVIALGSLVTYFTQTKRGAEFLSRAMAGLKASFSVVVDLVSSLGEKILNAFTNPKQVFIDFGNSIETYVQKKIDGLLKTFGLLGSSIKKVFSGDFSGAIEDASQAAETFIMDVTDVGNLIEVGKDIAGAFSEVAEEMSEAAKKAAELEAAQQALIDSQRETLVLTAKQRSEIKQLNLIAEDTTKSVEERINAAEEAGRIERELFERRRAEAEEALRIRREQNALSESTAEDLQAEAELEAEVYNLRAESLELQTTLQNKLNGLVSEAIRLRQEEFEAIERLTPKYQEQADEKERTLVQGGARIQENLNKQESDGLTERQRMNLNAAQGYADIMNERVKQVGAFTTKTLDIVNSLNTLFTSGEEKRARRSFAIRKALGISTAVIGTAQAIVDALAKDSVAPFSRYASAAAAAVAGAAQIAIISREKFEGGASAPSAPSLPSVALQNQNRTQAQAPQIPSAPQEGFRSYVLSNDVSNGLQANQKLREQALLSF